MEKEQAVRYEPLGGQLEQKSQRLRSIMDEVIQQLEATEGHWKTFECVSKGRDVRVEQNVQSYLAEFQKLSRIVVQRVENIECKIRREVEAMRKS